MNKQLVSVAAVAAMAAGGALAVESQNIVGYNDISATRGTYYMIGAQYENVGGGEMAIQDFVTGTFAGVDFDENFAFLQTAPKLQVWVPGDYIMCYYLNDAYDTENSTDENDVLLEGWANNGGEYVTESVSSGMAAWFMDGNEACTLKVKGQVLGTDGTIQTTANTYFMIANPYPVATPINSADIDWDGIIGVDFDENFAFLQTAPKLQVWIPGDYIMCYYLNDAYDTENSTDENDVLLEGWANNGGEYVTDSFPVGYAAWFYANTDVDITFASPIAD